MPTRRTFLTSVLLMCVLLWLLTSCRQQPISNGVIGGRQDSASLVYMEQPVKFCWRRPARPWSGGAQILLDSSGSMGGFRRTVPPLVNWLQHGISRLQTSTLNITGSRLCHFSEGFVQSRGLGNCAEIGAPASRFEPAYNTNVHMAIASAKDYGLTMIVTDGVAASTGGRASDDCANGVDASCVARALRDVVSTQGSQPEGINWGVWVIPLAANYDGLFYTEEPIAPASFDATLTQQKVRNETGVQPLIQNPSQGRDGRLNFNYRGPRLMLLIVIARWADLGRSAVEALWERMEGLGIRRASNLQDLAALSDRIAAFPPIEMYPGFVDRVEWNALEASEEAGESRGTMDVYFAKEKQAIEMTCPAGETGAGIYHLSGKSPDAERVSGCVGIRVIPPFTFELQAAGQDDDLTQFVQDFARQDNSADRLRLALACDMSSPRPCPNNPFIAQWVGLMRYEKAADVLASGGDYHTVLRHIMEISTRHPNAEPHRIYGFADTLEAFYREMSSEQQSVIAGELQFCHR